MGQELPALAVERLRRKGGGLIADVVLDEEIVLDPLPVEELLGLLEGRLVRHGADDNGANNVGISIADASLMGGMGSLTQLLRKGDVGSDEDVEVLLTGLRNGFPCFLRHVILLSI